MVLVQKWKFFQLFVFLGNIGQENVFHEIIKHKNEILENQTKKFKKVEKLRFFQRG